MLLGTFKIAAAFRAPGPDNPLRMAMDTPWRQTMPKALHARGLLLNPGERPTPASVDAASRAWVEWIAPHVDAAPIAVETVFDWYWWMTYSCKFQFDMVRVLRNRESAAEMRAARAAFVAFFHAPEFDQWAFHHHAEKLADRRVWASYKLPLKRYIRDYDGDDEYYARKTKVSSSTMQCGRQVAITADLEPIAFGVHSISRRRMRGAARAASTAPDRRTR